ncbi:hypothetical protein KUTeg_017705 [Tegillarca granosa]|uniref:P/Homo B domain-containing protein n=1 Tax=Tegillarca granosa TaxID=220873 RepID=A0ABQ9EKK8_TEGGR|nr:hypothetical protein KUTeg_017705 [Tegillarca granosa]
MIELVPKTDVYIPLKSRTLIFNGSAATRLELAAKLIRVFFTREQLRAAGQLANLNSTIIEAIIACCLRIKDLPEVEIKYIKKAMHNVISYAKSPHLTWRDMQHIVILAAKKSTLIADDWVKNGVGKDVSHAFGFGLMDSLQMVSLAKIWENVSPQRVCRINTTYYNVNVPYDESVIMELTTSGCNESQNYIRFLEHVQVEITIAAVERRGEIEMYITSPMGTRSTLLSRRPSDYKPGGFVEYPFMTVHSWGERPNANLTSWSLILMGTERDPIASLPEEIFDETEDTEMTSGNMSNTYTKTTNDFQFNVSIKKF